MSDNIMYSFFWLCGVAVLLSIVAAFGFNYSKSLDIEAKLIIEYGINPVILKCASGDFKQDGAGAVFCLEALKKYEINDRDISKLRAIIDKE